MTKTNYKMKILVVEDEKPMQEVLVEKLTEEGFKVFAAKDGEEGLKKALSRHPNLIIVDILMPKMDGIEMLKELRKDDWGAGVKAVLLTNVSDTAVIARAFSTNTYDYLVKTDCNIEDVIKKVKDLLDL